MKRGSLLLLCVMQSFIFVLHAQNTQRNIAYTDDNVRFTVISDGAIRLEYAQDGKFVDDRSHIVVNRNYPQVDYKLKTRGGWVEITTSKMKMRYKKNSGQFTDKNLVITASKEILPFTWKPGMQQKGNLKGTHHFCVSVPHVYYHSCCHLIYSNKDQKARWNDTQLSGMYYLHRHSKCL